MEDAGPVVSRFSVSITLPPFDPRASIDPTSSPWTFSGDAGVAGNLTEAADHGAAQVAVSLQGDGFHIINFADSYIAPQPERMGRH